MNDKKMVYQPNLLTHAHYNLTKQQTDLVILASGLMDTRQFIQQKDGVIFDIRLLHELTGSKMRIDKYIKSIKKSLLELSHKTLKVDLGNGDIAIMPWLGKYQYSKDDSVIGIFFNQKIVELYNNMPSKFTLYPLLQALPLNSFYAKRLYQILMQFKPWDRKETIITVEKFRQIFELEQKYSTYIELNRSVLIKAINEINQFTDIKVKMSTKKQSNKVIALVFEYKFKSKEFENHYKNSPSKITECSDKTDDEAFKLLNKQALIKTINTVTKKLSMQNQ